MNDDAVATSSLSAHEPSYSLSGQSTPARTRKAGLAKKYTFTTHLMTNLDTLVYAELCTLYYMDCSLIQLLLRLTVQSFFLSPKSAEFLMLMPAHRPHIVAVFLPNILCMLMHLIFSLPQASEATRGYLHGGVIIDFVGQKAPTSKVGLIVLDLAVLVLQCVMLSVHGERERLRRLVYPAPRVEGEGEGVDGGGVGGEGGPAAATTSAPSMQDHDAEERGVTRDSPNLLTVMASSRSATDDIELQPLQSSASASLDQNSHAQTSAVEGPSSHGTYGRRRPNLDDYMMSGNALLGDFNVLRSVREAGSDYQAAAAQSLRTIGYVATLSRLAADPRSRLARLSVQREQQRR